jgi:hypothetical protein
MDHFSDKQEKYNIGDLVRIAGGHHLYQLNGLYGVIVDYLGTVSIRPIKYTDKTRIVNEYSVAFPRLDGKEILIRQDEIAEIYPLSK